MRVPREHRPLTEYERIAFRSPAPDGEGLDLLAPALVAAGDLAEARLVELVMP